MSTTCATPHAGTERKSGVTVKAAILVLSDPKSGSEEVKDKVAGVSCGCADVFGGAEDAEQSGFKLIKDNLVPGTTGLPSLQDLVSQGFAILTF